MKFILGISRPTQNKTKECFASHADFSLEYEVLDEISDKVVRDSVSLINRIEKLFGFVIERIKTPVDFHRKSTANLFEYRVISPN